MAWLRPWLSSPEHVWGSATPAPPRAPAAPAIRPGLRRPARPSAAQAQLLIPALPAAASAERGNLPPAQRSREGPRRLSALLCRSRNHLKGHFVGRSTALPRRSGAADAACPQASFRARSLAGNPRPSLPLPAFAFGRGFRSCEQVCGAWRAAPTRLREPQRSPMPPPPAEPRLSGRAPLSARALLGAWRPWALRFLCYFLHL